MKVWIAESTHLRAAAPPFHVTSPRTSGSSSPHMAYRLTVKAGRVRGVKAWNIKALR